VAVVLREATDAHQAVERAGPLVAVDGAQLEQAQRQLAVAALRLRKMRQCIGQFIGFM
jgi:hypothetical protein